MSGFYDLHTHTTLTDGEMIPAELVRRMAVLGYTTVAITDHADSTNLHHLIESIILLKHSAELSGVRLLSGVELTHIPPSLIPASARDAKNSGADIVLCMGSLGRTGCGRDESCSLHLQGCGCACAPWVHHR